MIDLKLTLSSTGAVRTSGYENRLRLGYNQNKGIYRLNITPTGEWKGLTIRALWSTARGEKLSTLVENGKAEVPALITSEPGEGRLTFEGSDGERNLTSADVRYSVAANSKEPDDLPEPGTPAWEQLVRRVEQVGEEARQSADEAGQKLAETEEARDTAVKAIKQAEKEAKDSIDEYTTPAKNAAVKAVQAAQTAATDAVAAAAKPALEAAEQTKADADSAGQSAQDAAKSLQALKDGIASGDFKGETGPQGPQGPAGPPGEKGEDGASGMTPEQFGAAGDGVSDDAAALQAALDKAAENRVALELKTGAIYLCKEYLELPSNCTLHGNGAVILSELTYEKLGADRPFLCITGSSNTDLKHDITIDGLILRATDNCQCNIMFRVMRARDITVANCLFDCEVNEQNRSCMDLYGVYENVLIQNNVFRQLTAGEAGGIWVRNWKGDVPCQNVRILDCDFYKAGGDEVLAVWGWNGILKDVLISGCNFYEVDDEKHRRGYYPVWGITLGQRGIRTDVRMENCIVRMNRCETLFRMLGDGTHAVVDNCDIYSEQPDDMEEHDYHKGAFPILARGNNRADGSTLFSNNHIHLYGDRGRRICYQVSALRNNYFDVTCGYGPSSTKEVSSNVFQGSLLGLFWDCDVARDNLIELTDSGNTWMSGAGQVIGNDIKLDITTDAQGSAVFHNNWGSGSILNNRLTLNFSKECDIRQYEMRGGPQYVQNNLVTISGARYTHLQNAIDGIVYRRNNFFNDIPEPLFECTNVTFVENTITEQYKKYTSLDVAILPKNCTDPVIYTWSDPDGVLDIGSYGDYRPVKDGTASVTVTCGMFKDTQTIRVSLVPVACESVRLSRGAALCGVGQTTWLKAFVEPYWTTDEVIWTSSAEDVATVSQDGEVALLKTGSANITVTCGGQSASCALTVVEASELPTYTEGELLLDNIVAYMPLPDLAKEHTLYAAFDVDTNCVSAGEELPLISNLMSGQTGQEAIRVAFGADANGYKTIRWYTTDVETDEDGSTTLHRVPYGNTGFTEGEPASTSFLYLRHGIAGTGGGMIWTAETSTVKAASDSGYLSLNVQTSASDQPVSNYTTGIALQTALDSGSVHATKATGFKLKELILFANSSYTTLDDIKKYREGAEIDLRFDEKGEPVNAGTAGAFVIAGKDGEEIVPVTGVTLDKTSLSLTTGSTAALTATVLPTEATDKTVRWTVSPEGIAALSADTGAAVTLSAVKAGTCTVTATAGGKSAVCAVTVAAADTGETNDPVPVFSLTETNFVPENATVVDTGIKLFESADGAKDYTIIISQKPNSTAVAAANKYCLLHCMEEIEPWPGFSIAGGNSYGISVFTKRTTNLIASAIGFNSSNSITFAVRFSGKQVWAKAYAPYSKSYVESKGWVDITDYAAVDKSLLIGGYQESDGTKGRFWDGIVYFCKIYDKLLTEEQINKIMKS